MKLKINKRHDTLWFKLGEWVTQRVVTFVLYTNAVLSSVMFHGTISIAFFFKSNMLHIFILVINQLDAQNLFYSKFIYASTCFEHYVLIIRRSKLYCTASGIITPVGGRPLHRLREDCARDGHLQVWRYQMLYNTILTSWWWAHSARNT